MLNEGASRFMEILAIDKVPRHLQNLVHNGNLRVVRRYDGFSYRERDLSS